jgi:hypothetical protein
MLLKNGLRTILLDCDASRNLNARDLRISYDAPLKEIYIYGVNYEFEYPHPGAG